MDHIRTWRALLLAVAITCLVAGLAVGTAGWIYEAAPYIESRANAVAPFENLLIFGGPALVVLGAVAFAVRWRLPHIAAKPAGTRSVSIVLLAVLLAVIGGAVFAGLTVVFVLSYAFSACTTQGC